MLPNRSVTASRVRIPVLPKPGIAVRSPSNDLSAGRSHCRIADIRVDHPDCALGLEGVMGWIELYPGATTGLDTSFFTLSKRKGLPLLSGLRPRDRRFR